MVADRLGLYVHIPFCPQRCPYCAFAVVTGRMDMTEGYVQAVCDELVWSASSPSWGNRGPFDTVFFGGGTPSRLAPKLIARILETANRIHGIRQGAEITLEANPTTADAQRFGEFRDAGVNRLSIGMQSLVDETLLLLGRTHSAADAIHAYSLARQIGFRSVNCDLIFSVPAEPAAALATTIEQLLVLEPDHISAYALSVEKDTPFHRRRLQGDLPEVDEDDDATQFAQVRQHLTRAGFEQYEISNFSRPGHRCAHNWDCWTGGEYLGIGLSSHSFVEGERWWNLSDLDRYCQALQGGVSPRSGSEAIGPRKKREERIWLGLRTCEGVELEAGELAAMQSSSQMGILLSSGRLTLERQRLRLVGENFAIADAVAATLIETLERDVAVAGCP